ncbi:MAG TPA: AsmA-like C-terminal region-containing protein [Pelagibacteraceae bacterium]|jgi:hypothetical protein|nr:AsmA-like C-terminal region-containing protein [Alphaproteobacteria bacterium]HJO76596.1 AsmA-like C-terminal region-containing protein [Pelagibacteraceae bacterium]
MQKKFIFIAITAIILILICIAIRDNFNLHKIIAKLEKQTDLTIILNDESKWNYYPHIELRNNITIKDNADIFIINNADIDVSKNYWPASSININLRSPTINVEGIQLRNATIISSYKNNNITFEKIVSDLVEGNINAQGKMSMENEMPFELVGSFNNVSLNILMNQAKIATWDRVKIKMSSPNFNFSGAAKKNNFNKNLKGNIAINGSIFFVSTEEELFGAALLSLLIDKLPDLSSISNSVNFLLEKFSNIPSSFHGTLTINEGMISTQDMLIVNDQGRASLAAIINIETNIIDGKINFYEDDEIYLEATLKGDIQNPQILVGGKVFAEENDNAPRDIKKLFEEGIHSLIDKLLKVDD